MADHSKIEWTDATWNPIRGCSRVSEGCRYCYAERIAARFSGPGGAFEGLAVMQDGHPRWTGKLAFSAEHLADPLRWRRPRRIFVNSMSDLFHEEVTGEWLTAIYGVMCRAPQHTFQILTKRPGRARDYLEDLRWHWLGPPPNIWLGVSVEDQKTADERIPTLLECFAAKRFISYEPALGPLKLEWKWVSKGKPLGGGPQVNLLRPWEEHKPEPALDWVIAGGESGPGARPAHPDWFRTVRDQCVAAHVPFFFKQWGAWVPGPQLALEHQGRRFSAFHSFDDGAGSVRAAKHITGRLLDGREWNEFPAEVRAND